MLVSLKDNLNHLKNSIFEWVFKEHDILLSFFQKIFFSQHTVLESLSHEEENMIQDVRNYLRLEKKTKAKLEY